MTLIVPFAEILTHRQNALNRVDVAVYSYRLRHQLSCSCKRVLRVGLTNASEVFGEDRLHVGRCHGT